ncbi:MAG: transglycosylase domain-containing protein, partial [Nevskiaceae bacterium]|nr:transglycosylase domain-containing protein [Nevskiaceae bacterium]
MAALISLLLLGVFALAGTYVFLAPSLPDAATMRGVELAVPLRVYSSSGGLISQIGEQRRIPITFDELPELVWHAVISAEDDRFFEHSGVDWMGVTRAVAVNVASAGAGQGGSTITQQAARNMFLTLDKTLRRKLAEVFVTYRMEHDFTKEQILATYLNVIFFGQRSYGIAAAAETFYGKRLDELTVSEAATLAGIVQAPARLNPISNPQGARTRRNYVLRRMTQLGYIDAETAAKASEEPVGSRGFAPRFDVEAPYVAELARQEVVRRFGEGAVNSGYKVFTTIDGRLQAAANRALRLGLIEYDRRHGYRGAIEKVTLSADMGDAALDDLLDKHAAVNLLQPAVVTKVDDTAARVHIRGEGEARILWEGMSWARKQLRNGVGAVPRKAADVLAVGDVVYVISDRRGTAQLGQLPEAQGALVALNPQDGAVVSMVGGFDFFNNNFNRVTQARRQPGSGFKPFFYSAALDMGFTPSSVVLDMPVVVDNSGEENWRPENSGGDFAGPLRLREALVRSRNTVSIRVLQTIGISAAIDRAALFGFDKSVIPRNLTLALGTLVARPLDMATGYATFANGGFKVSSYYIDRIEDASGKVLFQAQPQIACAECETPESTLALDLPAVDLAEGDEAQAEEDSPPPPEEEEQPVVTAIDEEAPLPAWVADEQAARPIHDADAPEALRELAQEQGGPGYLPVERLAPRVISAQNAWLMTDIMKDVVLRGTAQRARALGRSDLAGKTGTTNNERDAWFNGFNGNLVASVWVGFDTERSLGSGEDGARSAVPIWMSYMSEALRSVPTTAMPRPPGIIDLKITPYTGTLANPLDPEAITEHFMIEHQPRMPEPGEAGYRSYGSGDDGGSVEP